MIKFAVFEDKFNSGVEVIVKLGSEELVPGASPEYYETMARKRLRNAISVDVHWFNYLGLFDERPR